MPKNSAGGEVWMNDQQRFTRRNEAGFLGQGILFFLGLAFIDGNAVVPVFISAMGGSLALAGLANAVRVAPDILAQLFIGVQSGRIGNLPRYITTVMAVAYALPILMAAVLLSPASAGLALGAFLVLLGLFWAGDGSVVVGWYDLYGRVTEPRRRGLILGWQQLFGGILALAASFAVRAVLGAEALPVRVRYAILFGVGGVIMAGSAIAMAFVRDVPHRVVRQESFLEIVRKFPALFTGNPMFRRMTAVQALQGVAVMALPILSLFSQRTFHLTLQDTAWLVTAQTAGSLSGGFLWGQVSHRLGNRRVIFVNQCNIFLIMALALTASFTDAAFLAYPLSLLAGLTFSCWLGYPNYTIDITSEGQRPQYLVMSSLVNLPFTFLPWVAGLLAGKLGFVPVFALCMAAAAGSIALSSSLKEHLAPAAQPDLPKAPENGQ